MSNTNSMSNTNIIDTDIIGDYNKYYCKISKSYIIFKLTQNIVCLDTYDFVWEYPKLIMNLIKFALFDIIEKYENMKYFKYTIPVSELEFIDKTKFSQIYDDNGEHVELKCDINNAYENFIAGFIV